MVSVESEPHFLGVQGHRCICHDVRVEVFGCVPHADVSGQYDGRFHEFQGRLISYDAEGLHNVRSERKVFGESPDGVGFVVGFVPVVSEPIVAERDDVGTFAWSEVCPCEPIPVDALFFPEKYFEVPRPIGCFAFECSEQEGHLYLCVEMALPHDSGERVCFVRDFEVVVEQLPVIKPCSPGEL